jgi:23S rRNA (cytosine1962-C5)-methyltransferase
MHQTTRIILNKGKDEALKRKHPWVFSGAIKKIQGDVQTGSFVELWSSGHEYLGCGIYQDATIAVRIMAFAPQRPESLNRDFWKQRLNQAYELRLALGLAENQNTTAYRLVHGEGDHLPGLIIDYYDGSLVIQAHSAGISPYLEDIAMALKDLYGPKFKGVYDKSRDNLPLRLLDDSQQEQKPVLVKENDHLFWIDIIKGQKTGFYLDQRENRQLLAHYCKSKTVLNTFSYSGGFSVYALKAAAQLVHSVDSSSRAIELTNCNVAENLGPNAPHQGFVSDTLQYLAKNQQEYDVIVLDPPAYAKHLHSRHNAVQGYKRLNMEAMKRIKPGGILFTFSCSQVVDTSLFRSTIMAAAIQCGRTVRILHQLTQPADHPVNIFHPEGEYLKGLVLFIE